MAEKIIQLSFSEEEIAKLQSSADAHKMGLEEFIKKIIKRTMEKTSH